MVRVFFAVWPVLCFCFGVWAGGVFFLLCCLGGVRVFFLAVWAGDVFFLLLFGRGTGVHSLTGLPGSCLRDPPSLMRCNWSAIGDLKSVSSTSGCRTRRAAALDKVDRSKSDVLHPERRTE